MAERHAIDAVTGDLLRTYRNASRRLELIVGAGLRRGLDPARVGTLEQLRGDATQAYRARQLAAARRIAGELERMAPRVAPVVVRRAYASTLFAVDRVTLGRGATALATRFGGVHQRQVNALAANMSASLEAAARNIGTNVERVFGRAELLAGGVPPHGFPFVGRRVNDPWRKVALDTLAEGIVGLETRREISAALYRNLIDDGVTDALTGFVDRAGRRIPLEHYASMVARTTTREAASQATAGRLRETGLDLVTVSSHDHPPDECDDYDGATFSLSGDDDRYDELPEYPPFHPNCVHSIGPASVNLDDFERELEQAVADGVDVEDLDNVAPAPQVSPPDELPDGVPPIPAEAAGRPLNSVADPSIGVGTPARKEAVDRVDSWALDPGEAPDVAASRRAWQDAEGDQIQAYDRARRRSDTEAIDEALGPDLVAILDELAASGYKDAKLPELRQALRDGDVTIDYIEELAEAELKARYARSAERKAAEAERGLKRKPIPCFVCGQFKRRPADVCKNCGDDPLHHNPTAREIGDFNAAYGYPAEADRYGGLDYEGPIDQRA